MSLVHLQNERITGTSFSFIAWLQRGETAAICIQGSPWKTDKQSCRKHTLHLGSSLADGGGGHGHTSARGSWFVVGGNDAQQGILIIKYCLENRQWHRSLFLSFFLDDFFKYLFFCVVAKGHGGAGRSVQQLRISLHPQSDERAVSYRQEPRVFRHSSGRDSTNFHLLRWQSQSTKGCLHNEYC